MSDKDKKLIRCPLCGYRFKPEETGCSSCPFAGKCRLILCPNCGYHFPLGSKLAKLFRIKEKNEND